MPVRHMAGPYDEATGHQFCERCKSLLVDNSGVMQAVAVPGSEPFVPLRWPEGEVYYCGTMASRAWTGHFVDCVAVPHWKGVPSA